MRYLQRSQWLYDKSLCQLSPTSPCCLGGEDGAAGLNLLHKADGRVLNLGAKNSISLQPGVKLLTYYS